MIIILQAQKEGRNEAFRKGGDCNGGQPGSGPRHGHRACQRGGSGRRGSSHGKTGSTVPGDPLQDGRRDTKESIIEKTYCCENLPQPLFAKEGEFLPFVKGGKEGFGFRCPHNYGLISNSTNLYSGAGVG